MLTINGNGQDSAKSLLPAPFSCRSKVHEYGGGSYCVHHNFVYFVSADDQRIYRLDTEQDTPEVVPLTPLSTLRFADLITDSTGKRLIAVAEDHKTPDKTENYLVCIPIKNTAKTPAKPRKSDLSEVHILAQGDDFYASPRLHPEGKYLCWLSWNHPDMPWDCTQLWLAEIGDNHQLNNKTRLLQNTPPASIFQPHWSPKGDLFFVSDINNWWNIYQIEQEKLFVPATEAQAITQLEAEFAVPFWVFRSQTYGFLDAHTLLTCYTQAGRWYLAKINLQNTATPQVQPTVYDDISGLSAAENQAVFLAANANSSPNIAIADKNINLLTRSQLAITEQHFSQPQAIRFPTSENDTAHAFYYPPTHAELECEGSPPMIFICHGGPTGASSTALNLKIQYWTNRGFAVMDVNFRGSTGYGRHYREKLYRRWGEYDVDDMCYAAEYAVNQGWADPSKLIIKGGSAGGYTALACLCFRKTFSAGVSLYGIGDLYALTEDTHKFEAHYLDKLIGDPTTEKALYHDRSPINFVGDIQCPILVFQGLEDKVVPPNQAVNMVAAVENQGIPVAYVSFPDEGHGFRNPANIRTMLHAEHSFYCQIFKLPHPEELEQLTIRNL